MDEPTRGESTFRRLDHVDLDPLLGQVRSYRARSPVAGVGLILLAVAVLLLGVIVTCWMYWQLGAEARGFDPVTVTTWDGRRVECDLGEGWLRPITIYTLASDDCQRHYLGESLSFWEAVIRGTVLGTLTCLPLMGASGYVQRFDFDRRFLGSNRHTARQLAAGDNPSRVAYRLGVSDHELHQELCDRVNRSVGPLDTELNTAVAEVIRKWVQGLATGAEPPNTYDEGIAENWLPEGSPLAEVSVLARRLGSLGSAFPGRYKSPARTTSIGLGMTKSHDFVGRIFTGELRGRLDSLV